MTLRECLALLLGGEIAHGEERRMRLATGIAKVPFVRRLEGFDVAAQPSLDPGRVRDLAACRRVASGDALRALGPPGVGKTHRAVGLGREAIRLGYSALFVQALHAGDGDGRHARAQAEGGLDDRPAFYARPRLPSSGLRGRIGGHGASATSANSAICRWSRTPRICSSSWSAGATSAAA